MNKPILITVGVTAGLVAGTSSYTDANLKGKNLWVKRQGNAALLAKDYSINDNGGFALSAAKFVSGEVYEIYVIDLATNQNLGSYTNGFDYNRVMSAMYGRLAFRGEEPPSRSGRYFQDFHAIVGVDNISKTMPLGSDLSEHLSQLQQAAILRTLNGVFREKEYYENVLLYEREDGLTRLVPNTGLFCGYEINIASDGLRAVQIEAAVLNFNTDVTFPLYLFKDGKKSPIWQQSVSAVAGEATVIPLSDLVLTYLSGTTKGGRFYFGYFQSDLGAVKAIEETVDDWASTRMFEASPFYSVATTGDFDRVNIQEPSYSYGLNLQMSSFRDHTAAIVAKANLFDEAIGLQTAFMVIEQIIYAVRSNGSERVLKDTIDMVGLQLELNGYVAVTDVSKVEGIAQRIKKELDRLNTSFFPKPKATTINLC